MNEYEALVKVVSVLKGQTNTAAVLSSKTGLPVKQQHVYNWLNRDRRMPSNYCLAAQEATQNAGDIVFAYELCPSGFGSIKPNSATA